MSTDYAIMIETRLALAYSPAHLRSIYSGILSLDRQFGAIVARARDPHLARIRLAWWTEQLSALTGNSALADPDLQYANTLVRLHDVSPAMLARLTLGWDLLLSDEELGLDSLMHYGELRGGTLFSIAARVAGCEPSPCAQIGAAWALVDFAFRCSDAAIARRSADAARTLFAVHPPRSLRSTLMSFALLAHFAQLDLKRGIEKPRLSGTPWRALRAISFALL
jgi:15-cis-phytoene synthase